MQAKDRLLEDFAVALDYWVGLSSEALLNPKSDLMWTDGGSAFQAVRDALITAGIEDSDLRNVFEECFRGFAVSLLTALDGGTAMADEGQRVYVVDENGRRLQGSLHDDFVGHLMDTGRLK